MPTNKIKTTKHATKKSAHSLTTKVAHNKPEPIIGGRPDKFRTIHRAMISAANEARSENERLGIPRTSSRYSAIVHSTPSCKKSAHAPNAG